MISTTPLVDRSGLLCKQNDFLCDLQRQGKRTHLRVPDYSQLRYEMLRKRGLLVIEIIII